MPDHIHSRTTGRTLLARTGRIDTTARGAGTQTRDRLACKTKTPACTECGALECLCRPRFFAGQLLTEQDLNRLDTYIQKKNRLHNLQLHGWGVVNGLEVSCNPCGDGVLVGCGYAIGPCGEDIVVCAETPVDVCALIDRCRQLAPCEPARPGGGQKDCDDLVEDWVLAIRYTEQPSRGITALRSGGCSCGSGGGSCGCRKTGGTTCRCATGGKKASSCSCGESTTAAKPRGAPAQCEPTVICEGYAFEVFRAPVAKKGKDDDRGLPFELGGPLVERLRCCLQALIDAFPDPPGDFEGASYQQQPGAWHLWCCRAKEALGIHVQTAPTSSCTMAAELAAIVCPDPQTMPLAAFVQAMEAAVAVIFKVIVDLVLACFCSALLPPCPEPVEDTRVPLAVLRVRRRDCAVVNVCNWTPLRKILLTMPTLRYWLGLLPITDWIRELLHNLCCPPPARRAIDPQGQPGRVAGGPPPKAQALDDARLRLNPSLGKPAAEQQQNVSRVAVGAALRRKTPLEPQALVTALMGFKTAGQGREKAGALSPAERANLPQFLALNQLVRPLVASALPDELLAPLGTLAGKLQVLATTPGAAPQPPSTPPAPVTPPSGEELDELKARIAKLEKLVEEQPAGGRRKKR